MSTEPATKPRVTPSPPGVSGPPGPRRFGRLVWLLVAVTGMGAGIGAFTFRYAEGFSYLGSEPEICVNCHIMQPEYDGWQKASHHTVARCVDCHLPDAFVPKYLAKAENGFRHGQKFTTGDFEEPITVKARGREILQANCVRCHADLVAELAQGSPEGPAQADCVHCHPAVGHGEKAGLGGPRRASSWEPLGPRSAGARTNHD
ncbi:MAG: cytochrome c nitrite reductase small subunit [Polyangiaceae bacterium]|nr:cytochrome c nitrite reductase small subunit [Polyangiaceae bacterium]